MCEYDCDAFIRDNLLKIYSKKSTFFFIPPLQCRFEWINLPKTINYMAAQTLVLNQDRCTKNFEVYLDPSTRQWAMLPWDIEGSFSSDRGLGGQPAADYCILGTSSKIRSHIQIHSKFYNFFNIFSIFFLSFFVLDNKQPASNGTLPSTVIATTPKI